MCKRCAHHFETIEHPAHFFFKFIGVLMHALLQKLQVPANRAQELLWGECDDVMAPTETEEELQRAREQEERLRREREQEERLRREREEEERLKKAREQRERLRRERAEEERLRREREEEEQCLAAFVPSNTHGSVPHLVNEVGLLSQEDIDTPPSRTDPKQVPRNGQRKRDEAKATIGMAVPTREKRARTQISSYAKLSRDGHS